MKWKKKSLREPQTLKRCKTLPFKKHLKSPPFGYVYFFPWLAADLKQSHKFKVNPCQSMKFHPYLFVHIFVNWNVSLLERHFLGFRIKTVRSSVSLLMRQPVDHFQLIIKSFVHPTLAFSVVNFFDRITFVMPSMFWRRNPPVLTALSAQLSFPLLWIHPRKPLAINIMAFYS